MNEKLLSPTESDKITVDSRKFLLQEYENLRKQIDQYTEELLKAERWNLIVSAAVWSWLATTTKSNLPGLIFWLPAIITFILGLRCLGFHKNNLTTAKYLADIE